jgi:hypothetical protein
LSSWGMSVSMPLAGCQSWVKSRVDV